MNRRVFWKYEGISLGVRRRSVLFTVGESTDFLVIGGGVAGLRAAIEAAHFGRVLLINKVQESASQKAQGGIAAVLNTEEGELESHYQDTMDAGHGLSSPEAVRTLVWEGQARVEELIAWGARFDKVGTAFAMALEGVHKKPRVLRAHGDATGLEIVRTLLQQAQKSPNVRFLENAFTLDLIVEEGACRGVWVMDETDRIYPLFAQGVILATGGAGQIFERTTNPPLATGDGVAMALAAGAVVEDMEFVQFHPTALYLPNAPAFLLSEAMRGEGARLTHADGKPFMPAYHPDAELAPRDIVTRAIFTEMSFGQKVFLDLTHLAPDFVQNRFPTIDATCRSFGLNITRDPIPTAPAAHYMMGGIKSDLDGRTSVQGLWACGEVAATGVHGANRLASNALLEGLVFGARAGRSVASAPAKTAPAKTADRPATLWPIQSERPSLLQDATSGVYAPPVSALREMMWRDVGIIRSASSLHRAIHQLRDFRSVLFTPADEVPRALFRQVWETRNRIVVAAAIIAAAKTRTESIGAHFRVPAETLPAGSPKSSPLPHPTGAVDRPPSACGAEHFPFTWNTICEGLSCPDHELPSFS